MKKIYESPEIEIKEFLLTECILSSIESSVNSEIHDFTEPGDDIGDL
ncbi:MAG: hypothetical protein IJ639_08515 [Ruminococcus sp.]|nr:hypothetical protein [Ruminococcus sp.]